MSGIASSIQHTNLLPAISKLGTLSCPARYGILHRHLPVAIQVRGLPATVMEFNSGLMPPYDLSTYGSDVSLIPPSGSRSVTASPPRTGFTAEQRELKRQRDQARHNSKLQARGRRTDSGASIYSPPASLTDMTAAASSMPIYTTALSQLPILAEPSAPQYMPLFSPPLQDQNQAATDSYPSQSYLPDYSSYLSSATPGLPLYYG